MKIKIPLTNKKLVLNPIYEGLLMMLTFYAIFGIAVLLFTALGLKNFSLAVGIFLFVGLIKTSRVENTEGENVKE
jgi:hypothetical protein